jgi:hypothetical protein
MTRGKPLLERVLTLLSTFIVPLVPGFKLELQSSDIQALPTTSGFCSHFGKTTELYARVCSGIKRGRYDYKEPG